MLITQEEILPRFIEHLSWAAEIDLSHRLGHEPRRSPGLAEAAAVT